MTRPDAASSDALVLAPALPATFTAPDGAVVAARSATKTARAIPTQRARSRRAAAVCTPLGSITTAPARTAPGTCVCGECASAALTHLQITLTDGTPVVFVSCHDCEHTGWFALDGTGRTLTLEDVLGSATNVR